MTLTAMLAKLLQTFPPIDPTDGRFSIPEGVLYGAFASLVSVIVFMASGYRKLWNLREDELRALRKENRELRDSLSRHKQALIECRRDFKTLNDAKN